MIGIYFSGTGNTKFCIEKFLACYDKNAPIISIENNRAIPAIMENRDIVFAYPIYYSNIPKIVRDFITTNKTLFHGKKIFLVVTMGLFSGDGTGCSARLFRRYQADITGGLHLVMPDCIGDVKLLKKPLEKNKQLVHAADRKIELAVKQLKAGQPPRDGLGVFSHLAGLFGQRLWFYNKTLHYSDKLKIDKDKCVGCGICVKLCPMKNIKLANGKALPGGQCTMCYRCVNSCPQQAITLLGKTVYEQPLIEKYLDRQTA